jgi:isopentenyl-diphosphate delta-isomerase
VQSPRSSRAVVLVDEDGTVLGSVDKLAAHQPPGQLHLAFSVFLYRDDGAVLLQQRAADKYHFPLTWANACCSHPAAGEDLLVAAVTRVEEELGVTVALEAAGSFVYRACCAATGLVEHELDHVFAGAIAAEPRPDPSEVAAVCFVQPEALRRGDFAGLLAPWLLPALELAEQHRGAAGADVPTSR